MNTSLQIGSGNLSGRRSNLHPFPARMAPEIALEKLSSLKAGSVVFDPMTGSGTVIRVATQLGHRAIGLDMDPLALLMTRVSTSKVKPSDILDYGWAIAECAKTLRASDVGLPWQDQDLETKKFISFWFGSEQVRDLRRLAALLCCPRDGNLPAGVLDALKLALSRIIITKKYGASLAWDVSHSRPHRVMESNDFDTIEEYKNACVAIANRLEAAVPCTGAADVRLGDARVSRHVADCSVDSIITSPPYLNAIDYMRGHKLALVWLGYKISDLRAIRSNSIGAERRLAVSGSTNGIEQTIAAFGAVTQLPSNLQGVVGRYAHDLLALLENLRRVIRKNGEIHLVVGDSQLRGISLSNSEAVIAAASVSRLTLFERQTREIPKASRYLPIPIDSNLNLGKRIILEHVLSFRKVQ